MHRTRCDPKFVSASASTSAVRLAAQALFGQVTSYAIGLPFKALSSQIPDGTFGIALPQFLNMRPKLR